MSASVCKLCLVGNGSVGKTSICQRFLDDGFKKVYKQTLGIDFFEKQLPVRGQELVMQVWDIGGQSLSSQMLGRYIGGSSVVMAVYDVTDPKSFDDLEDWLDKVASVLRPGGHTAGPAAGAAAGAGAAGARGSAGSAGSHQVFLVGNKVDLIALRRVTPDQHERFVRDHGLAGGFFVSAQSGEAVTRTFYDVAGRHLGVKLAASELAVHDKVLEATVVRDDEEVDQGVDEEARRMAEEDAAAEERRQAMVAAALAKEQEPQCACAVQ